MRAAFAALAFVAPAMLAAQSPVAYQRSARDTLHYREISTAVVEVTTPQGVIPMRSYHDGQMAITFGPADSATAWYEALHISATTPQGELTPDTKPALGLSFILRFGAQGHVQTLHAPTFPASFEGVSDLRHQFADYFLPLPSGPLAVGTAWQDSVTLVDSTGPDNRHTLQRWGDYRVAGDTTIDGTKALVIYARARQRMRAVAPTQGMVVTSDMSGEDHGSFYWDPARGQLLGRQRTGTFSGTLRMTGGGNDMEFAQRMEYENALKLIR